MEQTSAESSQTSTGRLPIPTHTPVTITQRLLRRHRSAGVNIKESGNTCRSLSLSTNRQLGQSSAERKEPPLKANVR